MIIWQRSSQYLVFGVVMIASMMGVGCGAKQPPVTLESARTAYTQAEQEPQIAAHAPAALQEAKRTLERAENAWENERDETEVTHLAYLTEQQVEIAEAVTERELAEAEHQTLSQERDAILHEARVREAELARIEAERAQREADQAQLQIENLQQQLSALQAKTATTERGTILTLDSVLFETNKATLKSGALENLYPLVTFLRENPERTIMIEGHTDSTGDEDYNLELSQQRADSVREFLTLNGIEPNRIMARGYGETTPVAPNDTAAGRQQNRRVELVFPN